METRKGIKSTLGSVEDALTVASHERKPVVPRKKKKKREKDETEGLPKKRAFILRSGGCTYAAATS